MKKLFRLTVILTLILSLATMSSPALAADEDAGEDTGEITKDVIAEEISPVTLMVYTPDVVDSPSYKALKEYASLVSDASEGLITLDIHHSGELGDANAAITSTQYGVIDIAIVDTGALTGVYGMARMLSLPFLFYTTEEAYEAANSDAGDAVFSHLPDVGLVYLAECDGSMRQIAANRPIDAAKDAEGLLISIPDNFLWWDVWNTLAAVPSVVAPADVPAAVAGETLQAIDGTVYEMLENENYDGLTDLSLLNYIWTGSTMIMNAATWNSLPLEAQAILKEQAVEAAKVSFDVAAEEEAAALEELAADGLQIISDPDLKSFRRAIDGADYYNRYLESGWCPADVLAILLDAR